MLIQGAVTPKFAPVRVIKTSPVSSSFGETVFLNETGMYFKSLKSMRFDRTFFAINVSNPSSSYSLTTSTGCWTRLTILDSFSNGEAYIRSKYFLVDFRKYSASIRNATFQLPTSLSRTIPASSPSNNASNFALLKGLSEKNLGALSWRIQRRLRQCRPWFCRHG